MWSKESRQTARTDSPFWFLPWLQTRAGFTVLFLLTAAALLLSLLLSASVGVAGGNFMELVHALFHPGTTSDIGEIMLKMRMPRALAALFSGTAFALAGGVMQGVTRNPLADAGLLGINAGAGFLVALTAVLFPSMSNAGTILSAFFGAALAVALVYGIGIGKYKSGPIRLILAGSAVSALLTSLSQAISLSFGLSRALSFWTAGSLSGITWQSLLLTLPWITGAGLAALLLSGKLSVLALGEESAAGLGVNVKSVRLAGIGCVLVMAGASVSLVGGISFLGLIVPHMARFLTGGDYRRLLPISALFGGILLVLADIAARLVNAPFDTPVGALVSAIGVPLFLVLTYRKKGAVL